MSAAVDRAILRRLAEATPVEYPSLSVPRDVVLALLDERDRLERDWEKALDNLDAALAVVFADDTQETE